VLDFNQFSSPEIENCLIFCLQHYIFELAKNHWHSFNLDDRTTLPGCMEALRKYICKFETEDSGILLCSKAEI
jgi:hypothetical protein